LVNVLFFGLIAAALVRAPAPGIRLLGATIGTLLLGVVVLGLVAVDRLVGERLRPTDDVTRQVLVGTGTLCLALLVPVVGWYLLATLVVLTGSGATILALLWRQESDLPATAPNSSDRTQSEPGPLGGTTE
jgi:hypothetical protein